MEKLKEGKSYDFKVVKEKCKSKFFRIKTPDGQEFDIHKFKFQYNQTLPDSLTCFVKQTIPYPIIVQDIAVHLQKFYQIGKQYEFKVKNIKKEKDIIYQIEDEKGFCFNLANSSLNLSSGNMVRCLVTKLEGGNVNLKYVGTLTPKFPIEFYSIEEWLKALKVPANPPRYYRRLLEKIPEFEPIVKKIDDKDPTWILDILQECTVQLPKWLTKSRYKLPLLGRINRKLEIARKIGLYILEESDYLHNCNSEQRSSLQSKLSNFVELFEQYGTATSKILNNTHEDYIDGMFLRLKKAGYLYKPVRQIRIMMTILKIRPELIHPRMGELFEILHTWNMENWNSEPFRSALVQHLQIFLEENYGKIHRLATNDSTVDNRVISRLIVALAVQRLFASEKDNIDFDLNRAILYRYNSYRMTKEVPVLIQKSIDALLGIDSPNEYSWEDTNNPGLLFNKLAANWFEPDSDSDVCKIFSSSKVDIHLRRNKIHIIAKDADSETTVLPNDLFDWMHPQISLVDDSFIKIGKKSKSLRDYKFMWEQINWSIFGYEEDTSAVIAEKRIPVVGDEVRIIIDDVKIDYDAYEKQRLQFHCTIKDDIFTGEGWMPCDTLHFVGWLSENNFDGSLKFATGNNGLPLIFKAKVSSTKNGLMFSMREEIDNFLLDSSFPGEENIGVVTAFDKTTNSYVCLSDKGSSYRIFNDDSVNNSLYIGQVIRIVYFEPDRSNFNSKYFVGLLASDQEHLPPTFNKNNSLFNLMQAMGEIQVNENISEVIEAQQIMTQEEIVELILAIHRRANYEKEYPKAFNLLGLATVIANAADEKKLYEDLVIQMELFELLQEFGKNKKIDSELVDKYKDRVKHSPVLERLYTRLKIVSDIDINENSRWLWDIRQNPRNETEGSLASLVLSYNLLPKELEAPRKQIISQISSLLDVTTQEITSKYYGDESQMVEFKSSIVYSPKVKGRPAPREQLHEITHIICGFMNARGGRLFIGVNDAGYENGLEDDLAYRKQSGIRATIDAMIVDLQNHLDRTLPLHAKDHFHIYADPESKKGVIVVEIAPVREPVMLDNIIYVRTSSVTKPRNGEERDAFIKDRAQNYDNLRKLWDSEFILSDIKKQESLTKNKSGDASSEKLTAQNDNVLDRQSEEYFRTDKIITGKHRSNVLHYYEDNYVEPSFYIYFGDDNKITVSIVDSYRENEPDCRLVLAVKEKETTGKMLIRDDKNYICAMPINQISKLELDVPVSLGVDSCVFVDIADNNDYLLSVIKASTGNLFYRLDKIDSFDSKGRLLCEPLHSIVAQEIVSEDKLKLFDKEAMEKDTKSYGFPLTLGDGTLSEEERISNLLTLAI